MLTLQSAVVSHDPDVPDHLTKCEKRHGGNRQTDTDQNGYDSDEGPDRRGDRRRNANCDEGYRPNECEVDPRNSNAAIAYPPEPNRLSRN